VVGSEFPSRPTRVLLADDEALFVEALGLMLARDERIEVVGWARDGEEAVRLAETLEPDVVLMDIAIPVMDGVEASKRIRAANSNVHVLLLTGGDGDANMAKAQETGATGFITKNQAAAELTEAITEIAALASAFGGERRRAGPRH
jgi:DNA-binding NarL/FixJ family response regulator